MASRAERRFRAAINRLVDMDPTRLERAAEAVFKKAEDGDIAAFRELADRVDGKPAQEVSGPDGGPLQFERIERVIVESAAPKEIAES